MISEIEGGLLAPRGWHAGATSARIKASTGERLDVALLYSDADCAAAGVFTQNQVKAAPVIWCAQHLPSSSIRGVVVNSGNANACTGEIGLRHAREMAEHAAGRLAASPDQILVGSTGVIGIVMPMDRISAGIKQLPLDGTGDDFNDAMMTTDSKRKQASVVFELGRTRVTLGGVTKGAGMIHPKMATMLCFITSDAAVEPAVLQTAVKRAADRSFNMLTVDGDTSTNDTLIVMCNGLAGNDLIRAGSPESELLEQAIEQVALSLARQMAADGEGASKAIEVQVTGGQSEQDAREAARAIVSSSLVKCAIYGNDPNWGRIMCALGNSQARIDEGVVNITVNGVELVRHGLGTGFDMDAASRAMKAKDVLIEVNLGLGTASAQAYGCDLTPEYVTFNAEYTT